MADDLCTGEQSYGVLALYYDELMSHVDYERWAAYALTRLGLPQRATTGGARLLDLGCGTGSVSLALARRGYDVIGIDGSLDMLAIAQQKSHESGVAISLLHQGLTDFEIDGEVDGVVCLCDTLNYLTHDGELEEALGRVAAVLRPGAGVLFDLHTHVRLREMAESVYADETERVAYIWQSEFDDVSARCTMYLTLFAAIDEDLYRRTDEVHVERAYTEAEVRRAVTSAGLQWLGQYAQLSECAPAADERRIFYVARRPL